MKVKVIDMGFFLFKTKVMNFSRPAVGVSSEQSLKHFEGQWRRLLSLLKGQRANIFLT